MYLDENGIVIDNKSTLGYLASGVPGTVAGLWSVHQKFGSMRWGELIEPAIKLAPVIKEVLFVLRKLKGTKTVGMSGSGATCFALFEPNDTVSVIKAEEQIKNYGWWTASTFLKGA